jgi:hypothetical protein
VAWKFSFKVSIIYTPTIILDYVHAHLNGGRWYLDLLKGVIFHLVQGWLKKYPPFFMAWKFSFKVSIIYTPTIILDYVHAHLNGRRWYLDLLKGIIFHLELKLYWTYQALALQLLEGT